jgi:alkylhydroperoxidase family enzyme
MRPRSCGRGIGEHKLWAIERWREGNLFDRRERVALEYADAITLSDLEVTDEVMARLKQQFDDDAIVELTALIAFQNMSSKFNAALDVPPQGFCRLP